VVILRSLVDEVEGTRVKGELQVLEIIMAIFRSLVNEVERTRVKGELLTNLLKGLQNGTDRLIVTKGVVLVNNIGPHRQASSYLRLTNAELYVAAMEVLTPTSLLYKSQHPQRPEHPHCHQFSYLM
jgi:hypothetical protein